MKNGKIKLRWNIIREVVGILRVMVWRWMIGKINLKEM